MSILKIDAEIAARLYLALRRYFDPEDPEECDCEGWESICRMCEARRVLNEADGLNREPPKDGTESA